MGKKRASVGVDLGGTSMMAVVASDRGKILGESDTATRREEGPDGVIEQIIEQITLAAKDAGISTKKLGGIGLGAPGAVDPQRGIVVRAPNLAWTDVPVGSRLSAHFGVPVTLGNDVQVAIQGEHAYGAAKGAERAIGIWVGTGVGGGIITRGELERGFRGAAGEIGHVCLDEDGPECPCGRRGCAEAFSSRTSIERDVMAAIAKGRKSVVPQIMKERNKTRMTSSVIQRALAANDPLMQEVIARAQHYLGVLAGNLVNVLDPEVIVIGGGIAERLGEEFVAPIREAARVRFLRPDPDGAVRIVPSLLGDHAGALGASFLALRAAR